MPITVTLKLVFQTVPELNRWAELMSRDWRTPPAKEGSETVPPGPTDPDSPVLPGIASETPQPHAPVSAGRG